VTLTVVTPSGSEPDSESGSARGGRGPGLRLTGTVMSQAQSGPGVPGSRTDSSFSILALNTQSFKLLFPGHPVTVTVTVPAAGFPPGPPAGPDRRPGVFSRPTVRVGQPAAPSQAQRQPGCEPRSSTTSRMRIHRVIPGS
jgi:hypothetical protein